MSTENQVNPVHEEAYKPGRQLKVSAYDNVSGLLVALLILVGFFVMIMFIIWLTTRTWWGEQPRPVLVEPSSGGNELAEGIADEMEEPGAEEVDELVDPQLKETMEAVTDVASTVAATLEAMQGNSAITGHGDGLGSNRNAGDGGYGDGQLSRWERWKVRYPPMGEAQYAAMMDEFGFELGCVGGGIDGVDIVANLRGPLKRSHIDKETERGYFLQPPTSENRAMDVSFLESAGVPTARRAIVHICPLKVENDIAYAERDFMVARKKELIDIKETILGIRNSGGKYEFYVIDQTYR